MWAQPLFPVAPTNPQLSVRRGQSAAIVSTVTNNSADERTVSVSFTNLIVVYSEVGDDDLESGELFGDRPGDLWHVGDRAECATAGMT